MNWRKSIRRTRQGDFELRLSDEERELLRSIPPQMREALAMDPTDPALARLYPTAYPEDAERDAEYRRLMGDELAEGRLEALDTLEASIDARRLDHDQALAWTRSINDVRLLLGTKLDVTEDQSSQQLDPEDPRAPALALYHYLSYLEEQLVEALDIS
jgi:uncharacterized protein DUF2017